jgi:hypothetical protein
MYVEDFEHQAGSPHPKHWCGPGELCAIAAS